MKVAYYSPLPPERSGVADYSALLVPALSERVDLAVARRRRPRPPRGTDLAVYHVGNDPDSHGWIVDALRLRPGVVVLHELVLHHLIAGITLGRRDGRAYLDAMEREAGLAGRLLAYGVLEGRVPSLWETRPQDFPLVGEVLELATGLIVHSRYVEERVRAGGYAGPLWRIPHPAWPAPAVVPATIPGDPVVGCFGYMNSSKRIPQLLQAFTSLRSSHPAARLVLVGPAGVGFDLEGRLEQAGLAGSEAVVREEYVDEERLWATMAACDVCVSLRAPTMGETSGIAIRALVLGKPLVVSDLGWFSELPGDVALKIAVDGDETVALSSALALLAGDPGTRAAMAGAARAHAVREHGLERVADAYAAALEETAGGAAVRDAVVEEVARAAAEVGLEPGSPETSRIAARLRETEL